MFFDYGDPCSRRELLHGCWKIDVLVFHHEAENTAARAAAKTMKCLPGRAYDERRCFLLMERAKSLEISSPALEREIRADHFDDVVCRRDLLNCF